MRTEEREVRLDAVADKPAPKTVVLTVRLRTEVADVLKAYLKERGVPLRVVLEEFVAVVSKADDVPAVH